MRAENWLAVAGSMLGALLGGIIGVSLTWVFFAQLPDGPRDPNPLIAVVQGIGQLVDLVIATLVGLVGGSTLGAALGAGVAGAAASQLDSPTSDRVTQLRLAQENQRLRSRLAELESENTQ
jgi:uncharacterized protein YcfJ